MPSIKVVPKTDTSRQGYELVQEKAFGAGAPGALQITAPAADGARVRAAVAADPAYLPKWLDRILPDVRFGR